MVLVQEIAEFVSWRLHVIKPTNSALTHMMIPGIIKTKKSFTELRLKR